MQFAKMKTGVFTNCRSRTKLCWFYTGVNNTDDFMLSITDT